MLSEFYGRAVVEARVWSHQVVVLPPSLDDDLRLAAGAEPFHAQAFVAKLAVEALVGAVLPGLAGVDQGDLDVRLDDPFKDRLADELRAVSERKIAGAPCWLTSRASTSITRFERMLPATSIAKLSRVNSSTTVKHLSC